MFKKTYDDFVEETIERLLSFSIQDAVLVVV